MNFIDILKKKLEQAADPVRAEKMSSYMRNLFPFYGVMAGPRKLILRQLIQEGGMPRDAIKIVLGLFKEDKRELHICGQELMLRAKKQWNSHTIYELETMITTKSWWDSVDYIASNLVGPYIKRFPEHLPKVHAWATTDNLWLQRTAILFQLKYKKETDTDWLREVILMHKGQTEFFIKKAIGWSLREYAKTNPSWVMAFVQNTELQALSRKEALKNL